MKTYTFHRFNDGRMMFYVIDCKDDQHAVEQAMNNPGTTMVCRAKDGAVVYPKPEHKQ